MHITLNMVVTYWLLILGCIQWFKHGKTSASNNTNTYRQYILYGVLSVYLIASTFLADDLFVSYVMGVGLVLSGILWPVSYVMGKRSSTNNNKG
jgi:hypothetical protein